MIMLSSDAERSLSGCRDPTSRRGPTWAYGITVGSPKGLGQGAACDGRSDPAGEERSCVSPRLRGLVFASSRTGCGLRPLRARQARVRRLAEQYRRSTRLLLSMGLLHRTRSSGRRLSPCMMRLPLASRVWDTSKAVTIDQRTVNNTLWSSRLPRLLPSTTVAAWWVHGLQPHRRTDRSVS